MLCKVLFVGGELVVGNWSVFLLSVRINSGGHQLDRQLQLPRAAAKSRLSRRRLWRKEQTNTNNKLAANNKTLQEHC